MRTRCRQLDPYLLGTLDERERVLFEQHLSDCSACGRQRDLARQIETELGGLVEAAALAGPIGGEQRLLRRYQSRQKTRVVRRRLLALAAACAAVLLTWIAVDQRSSETAPSWRPEIVRGHLREPDGPILAPPRGDEALVELGELRIGIAPESAVEVIEANHGRQALRLAAGRAAFVVSAAGGRDTFSLECNDFVVRASRAVFMASRSPGGALYVYVIDGTVELDRPGGETSQVGASQVYDGAGAGHRNLAAPERAAIEELLRTTAGGRASLHEEPAGEVIDEQSTGDPSPSGDAPATARDQRGRASQRHAVAASRRLILAGDYRRAARRLRHHLKLQPEDGDAWALLGDCLRKTQQWRKAIAAYARAAETANGSVANRARFLAASIHQDQLDSPEIAARLLRVYLRQGPGLRPLEAAAMARLADALEESGDTAAARRIRERLAARDRAGAASDAPQRIDQEE